MHVTESVTQQSRTWRWNMDHLALFLVIAGASVRLAQYLCNRSLWLDEAMLSLNITRRSFHQLLAPLDYHQGAPVGFLWAEKLVTTWFGNSEYALRLLPFLAGIFSLPFIYLVARRILTPTANAIAVGLFAFTPSLIYYSSEVKQYSSDVFCALLLLYMGLDLLQKQPSLRRCLLAGVVGAVVLWFSHPAVFVLAGVGITLLCASWRKHDRRHHRRMLAAYALWAISFAGLYWVSLHSLGNDTALLDYWSGHFMPRWNAFRQFPWLVNHFFALFHEPTGFSSNGIYAAIFVIGWIGFQRRKPYILGLLALPLGVALLASALHRYPFTGRLLLFTIPSLMLLIAAGTEELRDLLSTRGRAVYLAIVLLLFVKPVANALGIVKHPQLSEETRTVIRYARAHEQPGDVWYSYCYGQYAFLYYADLLHMRDRPIILGSCLRGRSVTTEYSDTWNEYAQSLKKLRGQQRVWFIFSHVNHDQGMDEEQFALYILDQQGRRLDSFKSFGAEAYLYDLSANPVQE